MPYKPNPMVGRPVIVKIPNRPVRIGIITGEGRKGYWWSVRLEGNKSSISINKAYCEIR